MNSRDRQRTMESLEGCVPQALAMVERLHALFPDVGISLGTADGDFAAAGPFWAAGGAGIEESLAYQDCFATGMTDRIRAAHLIAFYSRQLSVALGGLYLGAGLHADVSGIRFEEWTRVYQGRDVTGKRYHFRLDPADGVLEAKGISAFERVFTAHLAPVIAAVKKRTGLSSGAQWRLVADSLAGAFLEIGRAIGDEARGMGEALAIVKRRGSRLFSEELCYEEISATDPESGARLSRQHRIRCGCCLYFQTEGGSYCDTCVLLEPDDRRARLAAHLMRNGGA